MADDSVMNNSWKIREYRENKKRREAIALEHGVTPDDSNLSQTSGPVHEAVHQDLMERIKLWKLKHQAQEPSENKG